MNNVWQWKSEGFSAIDWVVVDDDHHMITVVASLPDHTLTFYLDGELVPSRELISAWLEKRARQNHDTDDTFGRIQAAVTQLQYQVDRMLEEWRSWRNERA